MPVKGCLTCYAKVGLEMNVERYKNIPQELRLCLLCKSSEEDEKQSLLTWIIMTEINAAWNSISRVRA